MGSFSGEVMDFLSGDWGFFPGIFLYYFLHFLACFARPCLSFVGISMQPFVVVGK